jgi:two-component system response regulator YesN
MMRERGPRMHTLLIVDDEKTTRESLAKYIPWDTLGVDTVRMAKNGQEALVLARQEPPQILLTDVRMPKMDGIELAVRMQALFPRCKIVFLSGYADKEYLKTAIQLRAVRYVEKPVEPQEVMDAVTAALRAWEAEERDREEAERLKKSYRGSAGLVREEIARALVKGERGIRDLRDVFPDAFPPFEPGASFTAAAVILRWTEHVPDREREAVRRRILSCCSSIEPFQLPSSFVGFVATDTMVVVVARRAVTPNAPGQGIFHGLLGTLRECTGDLCQVTVGVGNPAKGIENVADSFHSALQSAELDFYREEERLFFPAAGRQERFAVDPDTLAAFRASLLDGDREQAARTARALAEKARREEPIDVDSVRNAFFRLFLVAHETVHRIDPSFEEEKRYIWREIRERPRLSELTGFIQDFLDSSCGTEEESGPRSRKVLDLQRFLRAHYADAGLCLQNIADQAGLSRTYVSFLFKSATGQSINEYITRMRIDKAKELLREGKMRTHEVAAHVGYPDATYFSALFKRHVGSTPTEYRDNG